jgi:FlaG/FlaF family flagellin (archaellin)
MIVLAAALVSSYSVAEAQSLSAPTTFKATTYSKTQINLAWNDPNPGLTGTQESGYIVQRAQGVPTLWSKVFTSGPDVASWSSAGLHAGTTYYYRVRAYAVVRGQTIYSSYSAIASAKTQSNLYPNAPTSLTASALSETQIALKWLDNANNETGYKVQRAPSSSGPWSLIGTTRTNQVTYADSGLTSGTTHYYLVQAYNSTGTSSPSNVATGTTKPDDTTGPAGSLSINGNAPYTGSAAVTVTLAAIDAVGVTGYYVSTSATPPAATATGWTAVTSTTNYSGALGYTLTTADGTKTLYAWYKDAAGNVSATASASILLDQTAPTNGTVIPTPASGQVTLNWSGFADTGSGLASASYKLVFSPTGFPTSCTGGTVLLSGGFTSFTHIGLTNGTTYFYRVCVADKADNVATGATASATPQGGAGPGLYGFTAFPYDATFEAIDKVHEIILPNSNLYAIHGVGGGEECLAWEEALADRPLPDSTQSNWADVKARIPSSHAVYVAVTPTDKDRRQVISACDADGRRDPNAGPWRDRLDHPDVMRAYTAYVRRVVSFFQPRYLNIGIEMSELSLGHPEEWPTFEALFTHVYDTVKAEYPDLQIGMEFVLQSLLLPRVAEQVRSVVDKSDYLGLSFYPYGSPFGVWYGAPPLPEGEDQWRQPLTWVRQYTTKPIAICETGYITAPVSFPEMGLTLEGDPARQAAFLRDLVTFATQDQYAFVVWFIPVDYDRLYATLPASSEWALIWMQAGLFDKDLNPKPAWPIWQEAMQANTDQPVGH